MNLCLFDPKVTDYTLSDARCIAGNRTNTKHEFKFIAPEPGRYTLQINNNCGSAGCQPDLGYELTASLRHYTNATLTGPRVVRAHHQVTLSGKIRGLSSGKIAIQERRKGGWKTLTLTSVKANGAFVYRTRVGIARTYRVRAVFFGDASHLPTAAGYSFKVI